MTRTVKWGCLAPVVALISLIGIMLALDAFLPSGVRRSLPESASDIHEYYKDFGFTGDFTRLLTAKCSIEEFHSYAKRQGLKPVTGEGLPSGCASWSHSSESWWDPPSSFVPGYFTFEEGGYRRLLGYHDGRLYYDIVAW